MTLLRELSNEESCGLYAGAKHVEQELLANGAEPGIDYDIVELFNLGILTMIFTKLAELNFNLEKLTLAYTVSALGKELDKQNKV